MLSSLLEYERTRLGLIPMLVLAMLAFAGSAQAGSALEDGQKIEELSIPFQMLSVTPGIATYLSDPKTVCTVLAPDNDGFVKSLERLGPHVGQLTQNETLGRLIFDYAVIPGKAMKLNEFKNGTYMTRAKEPLYVLNYKGKTYIFSNPDHPALVKRANIKAGKCLVHTVDETVPPPSTAEQMTAWYEEYVKKNPEAAAKERKPPGVLAAAKALVAKSRGPASASNATAAGPSSKTATGASATGGEEPAKGSGVVLPGGGSSGRSAPSGAAPAPPPPGSSSTLRALNPAIFIATTVSVVAGFIGVLM